MPGPLLIDDEQEEPDVVPADARSILDWLSRIPGSQRGREYIARLRGSAGAGSLQ